MTENSTASNLQGPSSSLPSDFKLPSEWDVFGPIDRTVILPKAKLLTVPECIESCGKTIFLQKATATNGSLDLAPFIGGTVAGRSAYVFISFTLDHEKEMHFGFGADYWFEACIDGESFCDNMESGNWNWPPTAADYMESSTLSRGKHLLSIRFMSGGGSSRLCVGVFHGLKGLSTTSRMFNVDFSRPNGRIRPLLHGAHHGPVCFSGAFDFSENHRELGFSHIRTHDCPYDVPETVDVHAIFPVFQADVNDAGNYRFPITDDYLKAIVDTGEKIYYRLGESTEHYSRGRYWIHPPPDHDKWAKICVNIIRHYNDGWANGFHHGIEYWEIWNEPWSGSCWTGTKEEYFDLYEVTARAIKEYNTRLKVGGCGAPGTGDYGRDFIDFCSRKQLPLDFYSWHSYACRPDEYLRHAMENRRRLDASGFQKTESHLNEWNYLPSGLTDQWLEDPARVKRAFDRTTGPEGAAFNASSLIVFHDIPLDLASVGWARAEHLGLLDAFGARLKPFYAFKAFRDMLDTPRRVIAEGGRVETGLAVLAGQSEDGGSARILVSNFQHPSETMKLHVRHLPWTGRSVSRIHVLDADHNLEVIQTNDHFGSDFLINLKLPPATVVLVDIKPA